jgi:hypothetical protein
MSWWVSRRVSIGFAITISAGALGVSVVPVRADDAYLCGPDKIVYVAVADLETMKRTNPCIAAYYGIKLENPVGEDTTTGDSASAKPPSKPDVTASLKPLSDAEIPDRVSKTPGRYAALSPPRAMAGTDYRNVKIINAASAEAAWFRHTR